MDIIEIANLLRERLDEFKSQPNYSEFGIDTKVTVTCIYIATYIAELRLMTMKKINSSEMDWFAPVAAVGRIFDSKDWEDIGILYFQLSKSVQDQLT